jgi:protein-tyrosine phosphatase
MKISILYVCLGNICRSPAAESLLRQINQQSKVPLQLHVESAGIGSWHVGQLPHEDMREAAGERGLSMHSRAQQFKPHFFDKFDYILAVDQSVLHELYHYAQTPEHKAKIHLATEFSSLYHREEIPDPFSQGRVAFDHVLDMLEDACQGLLQHLKE